jgi:hypothetical protein
VFHLEDGVRAPLDHVRDGVPVRGAESERLEDQEIERALEKLALERRVALLRHARIIPLDHLPEQEPPDAPVRVSKLMPR